MTKKIPNETNLITNNKKVKIAFCGAPHDIIKKELNKLKNFKFEQKDLHDEDFEYVIMTNRIFGDRNDNTLESVGTCFEKIAGKDIVSVKRNGLMLSTLRKKIWIFFTHLASDELRYCYKRLCWKANFPVEVIFTTDFKLIGY